ncbi:MAG: hypothetical protein WCK90_01755, partial [archaeon]
MKGKRGDLRKILPVVTLLAVVFLILVISVVFAVDAAPPGPTVLKAQACNSEINSNTAGVFNGQCTPSALDLNDGVTNVSSNGNTNRLQGFNMTAYNSSITNCGTITNVKLCYEWWFTGGTSTLSGCAIDVDANGGASYTLASPSCPGVAANPGMTCIDVTSLENWACSNFFTAAGTRAMANMEAQFATQNRPLTVDVLYFNVTYTADTVPPVITIVYPTSTTYNSSITALNASEIDLGGNLQACWWSNNSGATNRTFTCGSNMTGMNSTLGSNTWLVYANDSFGNTNFSAVTFSVNLPPTVQNISVIPNPAGLSASLFVKANNVTDANSDSLSFFCSESSSSPVDSGLCTGGGNLTSISSPYNPSCIYSHNRAAGNYTVFCRVYDGNWYSPTVNVTYRVTGVSLNTSVIIVENDSVPSYFDNLDNGRTNISIAGSSGMLCQWSSSDFTYGSGTTCPVVGVIANCSINDVSSQGFYTRYISCQDSLGNSQTASDNLDVSFYLDYTKPTTSDNSVSTVKVPVYSVTLNESDNVDSDPTSYYCTSSTAGCSPTTPIDHLGLISYTSANRGANYLRYYSVDDAGNSQTIVNKTININQLSVFTSASDNAVTILGGTTVTITSVSSDSDAGQTMKLYVCNSSAANFSGCAAGTYCTATGTSNLGCGFASESDSATHTWYAYLFDALNESASADPLTGTYTTDVTPPTVIINLPSNASSSSSTTQILQANVNEVPVAVTYSLDGAANVSMTNSSSALSWTSTLSGLSIATHTVVVSANDTFGNEANSRVVFTITAVPDTTAPVITVLSPVNASYTGTSVLVNISGNENLSWAGYKLNSGNLTTLGNVSTTAWNSTIAASQESINTIIIFANDTSNNQANTTLVFYTDSRAPRYSSVSASPSPANVSQNVNCSIVWNDGFALNSVMIGENALGSYENHTIPLTGNGSASYLISGSKLTNPGNYNCFFYATDAAGNTNSTSTSFRVNDVTAPVITITSPSNATYNQQNITVSITTNENLTSAWYSLNGAANVSLGNTSTTSWNGTLTNLLNIAYTIVFYANDTSGNLASASRTFSVAGTGDLISPVITVLSPVNASYTGTSVLVNISTDEALRWAGYKLNGGSLTTLGNTSTTAWNVTLTGLTQESINTLIVFANDSSTNINVANTTTTFYVDSRAPRYSSVSASPSPANQSQSQGVNCSIVWNDGFALSSVMIGENVLGSYENHTIPLTANGSASYLISGSKLTSPGNYTCFFYATDAAGNTNTTSTSFRVNDVTAPVITITSPTNSTYNQQNVQASITTNENLTNAWYSLNGGTTNSSLGNVSTTSWNTTLNNLANTGYTIVFYANDTSGNLASASRTFSVAGTGDLIPPVITVLSPVNTSYTGTSVLVNISTDEALSWAGYKLNGGSLTTLGNTSTTAWNVTLTGLTQESTNTLIVFANDTIQNQANKTITFYVDSSAPRYSSVSASPSPANQSQSQGVTCSISWTDGFNITSVIIGENSLGSQENHTIQFSGTSGSASYVISGSKLTNKGSYACQFYATDAAGNVNTTSTTFNVNDITAPTITVTSPTNGGTYNQLSLGISLITNEDTTYAGYSLDGAANVSMSNTSARNWNATLTGLVSVHTYSIILYANDSSGNMGSSSALTFTVNTGLADTIPPVLTSTITNASYLTSTTLQFNVSSNENLNGSSYRLNSGTLAALTNISSILWNGSLSGLGTESTNILYLYGNDTSNNQGNLNVTFFIDMVSPRFLNVTASPSPANVSQNVLCNAYVNDTFALGSVKIGENATIPGTFLNHTVDLTSAGWANYTIFNVQKGGYGCFFYATDAAGNTNYTSTSFTVNDVTPPVLTINSPFNQTYGTPSILFSLDSNENLSSAKYTLNYGITNTSLSGSATSWSSTVTLADGTKNLTFYGQDTSGNNASASVTFNINTVANDTISPVITVISPLNASYSLTTSVLVNISGNENLSWAGYKLNGGSLTSMSNNSITIWNATITAPSLESTNTLIIFANDTSRNQANTTITFYVDGIAPRFLNVSVTPSPANETQNVLCNVYVNDTFALGSVKIEENASVQGVMQNHTIDLFTAGWANYTIYNVQKGNYACLFYATDAAGNVNTTSVNFRVNDVTAPILTINSPLNQSYSTSSVLFSLSSNENISSAKYTLNYGITNTSLSGSATSWSDTVSLANGVKNLTFYGQDTSGNNASVSITFVVDTTVNDVVPPVVTVLSPLNASYSSGTIINISISANENLSWAGYKLGTGGITTMSNTTILLWNATNSSLVQESTNTLIIFANDTSRNQA